MSAPLIELAGVTLRLPPRLPVLSDVSLSIAAGETVAVVGATGAGKSTLIKLLPRLYDATGRRASASTASTSGRSTRRALRRRIVVVSQDVFMFAGTLAATSRSTTATIDDERILTRRPPRRRRPRHRRPRPDGLDARVLERGVELLRRRAPARRVRARAAREPEILILDEATASVDPETERVIERGIAELMRGRTSIVIAHRLSTVRRASRIVVIHHGRIAEQGTHDTLLAHDGISPPASLPPPDDRPRPRPPRPRPRRGRVDAHPDGAQSR